VYLRERIRKEYVHAASREGSARVEKGSKEANHLRKSFLRKVEKFSAKARQFGSAAGAVSKSSVLTSYIAKKKKKKKKNRC
jgi:hypothetical protein